MASIYPNNAMENLVDLLAIAKEVGLSETDWFIDGFENLTKRWDDFRYKKLLQACLSSENFPPLLNRVFRNPVTNEEINILRGNYIFAQTLHSNMEVGLSRKALGLHTLISGATGFGKTNCLNAISESIRKQDEILEMKIDPKTQQFDFRFQVKKFPNTILLPLSMLRLNCFGPIKNVPRKAIMEKAIEVISDAFNIYDASQGVIAEHVERIFEREEKPCFQDVAASILSEKTSKFGRRQGYLDTLEVRLKNTFMSLKVVLNCRDDYFDNLYGTNVIFEVGGISDFAQKVIVPLIIMKLSLFKTYNPSKHLTHLLYFEEAQGAIFSKILEQRGRTPTVAMLATQARSYGMGLIVLCQNPVTKIITEMLSNSANIICFHVGGTEIKGMMDCMGLNEEQAAILGHLQPGEAIFKTSFGYTEPMHIKVNEVDNTPPSYEVIEKLMRPIWNQLLSMAAPVNKKVSIHKEEHDEQLTQRFSAHQPLVSYHESTSNVMDSELTPDDEILLKDVQLRPYEYTEDRYQKCTLSRNRCIKIKEKLCRLGYLEEVKIMTGKRGKPPTILRLLDKAVLHLGVSQQKGKGSLEHSWWQHFIVHVAKQIDGLKPKIEDMAADVGLSKNNKDIAIEITLHDSNIHQNIDRDFQKGYSEVWILVKDKPAEKKVMEQLAAYALMPGIIKVFLLNEIILKIKDFCSA